MNKINESVANIERILQTQTILSKKVLSLQEAALYLDLSEAMLYQLTSKRLIPHSKPSGKKIFFTREALDTWALSNQVHTNEEIETEAKVWEIKRKK